MTALDKSLIGTLFLILAMCFLIVQWPYCALTQLVGSGVFFGWAAWRNK